VRLFNSLSVDGPLVSRPPRAAAAAGGQQQQQVQGFKKRRNRVYIFVTLFAEKYEIVTDLAKCDTFFKMYNKVQDMFSKMSVS
jgi:hypothetical protein